MSQESADARALHVLAWLITQDDLLPVFMGATGVSEQDIRVRAGDGDFLASVVDFILMDDAWVMAWAQDSQCAPEELQRLRIRLPGGDLPNWT